MKEIMGSINLLNTNKSSAQQNKHTTGATEASFQQQHDDHNEMNQLCSVSKSSTDFKSTRKAHSCGD